MDTDPFVRALRKVPAIGVGVLYGGGTEVVGLGTIADEPHPGSLCWEIGSITKVFTGILLADMVLRGEVRLDDPIGRHAPPDVADRLPAEDEQPRLLDLATHTAGFPRIPVAWLRTIRSDPDPYARLTEQDVWDVLTASTRRPARRRSRYSNYGMGLLGHLLARRATIPYPELVRVRVLDPLGLTATGASICDPVPGFRKPGIPTPPWTFGALDGAGTIRSTADDMLRFAALVIDPPDAGWDETLRLARTVHHRGRFTSMGLGWQMRRLPGQDEPTAIWHNGGTYGSSSFMAIDLSRRVAVVAFGNRGPRWSSPLDRAGWKTFDELA